MIELIIDRIINCPLADFHTGILPLEQIAGINSIVLSKEKLYLCLKNQKFSKNILTGCRM